MTGKTSKSEDLILVEDFTTYYCPHCEEPVAVGILLHLKVVCPECGKLVVMVGRLQKGNA